MQRWFTIFALAGLVVGCSAAHGPEANGQTHWLRSCSRAGTAGRSQCIGGYADTSTVFESRVSAVAFKK